MLSENQSVRTKIITQRPETKPVRRAAGVEYHLEVLLPHTIDLRMYHQEVLLPHTIT